MKGATASDAFTRTVSAGWGNADTGQTWTTFWGGGTFTSTDLSVNGSAGIMSVPAAGAYRAAYLSGVNQTYADVSVAASVTGVPAGGALELGNLLVRGTSTTSYVMFRAQVNTDGTVSASIYDASSNLLGSVTIPNVAPYTGGTFLRIRAQAIGHILRMKVWKAANTEPPNYHLSVTDPSTPVAGWVGVRCGVANGNSNAKPLVFTLDNFSLVQVPDFPNDPLPLQVLAAFGADRSKDPSTWTWTDITADVRVAEGVSITRGRQDETSQASPARATFALNNNSMAYSANNPLSPNYPNVTRNTPIWVLVGAATRFFGYADGWPPSWDTTGKMAIVKVSASGVLRRLMQGSSPVQSPMRQAITAAGPVVYFPMEDSVGSAAPASGIGGLPMVANGTITYANNSDLLGSMSALTLTATSTLEAQFVHHFASNWQVDFYILVPSAPASETILMRVFAHGSPVVRWEWVMGNGYQAVHGFDVSGSLVLDSGHYGMYGWQTGQWNHVRLMLQQSGSTVNWQIVFFPVLGTGGYIPGSYTGTIGDAYDVQVPLSANLAGVSMAHLAVYDAWNYSATDAAGRGYGPDPVAGIAGELATDRITRLANSVNVTATIIGSSATTMGPQSTNTLTSVLRECETADMGLLFDGYDPGIGYVCRSTRYNEAAAMTLDMAAGQVDAPFAPADDDQRNRNVWVVSRKNGSSAQAQDSTGPLGTDLLKGIGTYDSSETVNLDSDAALSAYASWLVHLGTTPGFRHPSLNIDLAANPTKIDDFVAAPLNSRFDVLNPSTASGFAPDAISVLEEGYTETLGPFSWKVAANCSPYAPWRVFVLDTDRLDADSSSVLTADISSTATTFQVTTGTTPGALWTTNSAEWTAPKALYIEVGGEQMKVTNISGASSPQTFTVVRSVNGVVKAQKAGTHVGLWQPRVLAL